MESVAGVFPHFPFSYENLIPFFSFPNEHDANGNKSAPVKGKSMLVE